MNLRVVTHGKLPRLLREGCSYRQLRRKLLPILTWVMSLFLLASPVSAAYTPATPADLLAAVKPVTPVATALSDPKPSLQTSPTSAEPALTDINQALQRVPEIVIEIKAAEYVPPAVPTVTETGTGRFPFGQCTYYVATRRQVSWIGNGGEWFRNAQAAGRPVGSKPLPGSIMVSFEGNPLGHVSYVDSVNPDGSFVISEMNYLGQWGKVTSRTVHLGQFYIVGFIY